MRIAVTGGAGFIGSHYVRTTLAGGYPGSADAEVTVIDKLAYAGNLANLPMEHPRLRFVRADICDRELMIELLRDHDALVHFAAESHVDRSLLDPAPFVRTNVVGTQSVLDACRVARVATMVHVSTDEVYGSIEEGSWTEHEPLLPNSPYAASKAGSDLLARAAWRSEALDVRITRCSNNYGPYQHVEKLIPRFVTNLLRGQPVPLYGDGHHVREWLHVDDHCRAIHAVLTTGRAGEIYNIGSGESLSNREITAKLLQLCGADWTMVRQVPDRKGHDDRYAIDDSKIREQLGWRPSWSLDRGLADVVRWYAGHPEHWQPLLAEGPS